MHCAEQAVGDDMVILTYEEWQARGRQLYGRDPSEWLFRCVHCGHVQSVAGVLARDPSIFDAEKWIAYACEGDRNPRVGCTGAGKRNVYERAVRYPDGTVLPIFCFAADSAHHAPARTPIELMNDYTLRALGLFPKDIEDDK